MPHTGELLITSVITWIYGCIVLPDAVWSLENDNRRNIKCLDTLEMYFFRRGPCFVWIIRPFRWKTTQRTTQETLHLFMDPDFFGFVAQNPNNYRVTVSTLGWNNNISISIWGLYQMLLSKATHNKSIYQKKEKQQHISVGTVIKCQALTTTRLPHSP